MRSVSLFNRHSNIQIYRTAMKEADRTQDESQTTPDENRSQESETQELSPWIRLLIFTVLAVIGNLFVYALLTKTYVEVPGADLKAIWNAQTEEGRSSLLAFCVTLPIGILMVFYGLIETGRRSWMPFAIGLAVAVVLNGSLLTLVLMELTEIEKLSLWFFATVPLGLLSAAIGLLLSLKNHTVVQTFLCLIAGTAFAFLVTLTFPIILFSLAMYLKKNRDMEFFEVWAEGPNLYNFFILNVYPIFFQILPGLLFVRKKAKKERKAEKKKFKKVDNPTYVTSIDIDKLKIGDVILTGKDSWGHSMPIQASNLLSNGEQNRYWSHATIYSGNGNIIEAQSNGKGVIETPLADHYFEGDFRLLVLRHNHLSEECLENVVDYCREKRDLECDYDTWGVSFYALCAMVPPALSGWLEEGVAGKIFNVDHAYFCSELIAEAFEKKAQKLFNRSAWRVKPLDFRFNPLFSVVDCNFQRIPVNDTARIEHEQRMAL